MDAMIIADYSPAWPEQFAVIAARLRTALGSLAVRIDHTGSTAVPGLAAKPIIDLQVSVASLDPVETYRFKIESCGFAWRSDNPELTKRYFREVPPRPRTHLHVRRAGSFSEQFALLFRDHLRAHASRAVAYAELKHRLSPLLMADRAAYVAAKDPFIWETVRLADAWAQRIGWEPGPSDA
ncbi:GrpB family protein [Microlunatus sp. GCM10028923]|uniref:GrpB family protein n=1 Tax=Microlunatus sp. GCM10028923 TaxID=3273400 RepID=UPI00360624CE